MRLCSSAPLIIAEAIDWSYSGIYDLIEALTEAAGLENIHPHQTRHTAVDMLPSDMNPMFAKRPCETALTGLSLDTVSRRFRSGLKRPFEKLTENPMPSLTQAKKTVENSGILKQKA